MNFMDRLHNAINDEKKLTENGARGYAATGSALVDLNFFLLRFASHQRQPYRGRIRTCINQFTLL